MSKQFYSPIKWVGGKRRLLPQFAPLFPKEIENYYEPFMGSATVYFHLKQKGLIKGKAYLSDINLTLVKGFCGIRDNVEQVIQELSLFDNTEEDFSYWKRMGITEYSNDILAAVRLLFLNRTAFNGLWRENRKGEFNVPFGYYKNPTICNPDELRLASELLQGTEIQQMRQEDNRGIAWQDIWNWKDTFIYADPPYDPLTKTRNFTNYSGTRYGESEQKGLYHYLYFVNEDGGKFMTSNSNTNFIRDLYKDFNITEVEVSHVVAAKGTSRGKVKELVIRNYE